MQKYGAKIVLFVSTLLSGFVVALTPLAVAYGKSNLHLSSFF